MSNQTYIIIPVTKRSIREETTATKNKEEPGDLQYTDTRKESTPDLQLIDKASGNNLTRPKQFHFHPAVRSDESSGSSRRKKSGKRRKGRREQGETRIFPRAFTSRPGPALTPEARFNIRLWRLCFTVWDTHSAPFRPINPHSAFNLRVFASYSSPPWPTLVEGGRSPWRRRVFRRPIVGRLRCGVSPTKPSKTIIIDGEGREKERERKVETGYRAEGVNKGKERKGSWWWFSFFSVPRLMG